MIYKVYVLYSPKHDKLYTGLTTSLIDRMHTHNSDSPDEWTSVYQPWTLVHMELYNEEDEALLRETFLDGEEGHQYIREDVLPLFKF
ncbi:GIY-YIG nuclease family protein [Bacteroidota bacterium]